MKAALAMLAGILILFVSFPIWLYLLYKILVAVNATDLMWFMYWAYVPASLVAAAAGMAVKALSEE